MRKVVFLIFIILSSIAFAKTPQIGGTLVFGRSGDAMSLDPSHATDRETFYVSANIYNTLVQFKYGSTKIEPGLATSWDISKDGLEYIFHLRKGVYFHKTKFFKQKSEFTSKDVVFSLKRQFDKSNPYNKVGGAFKYWYAMNMPKIIKDVIALDKYTVKITLKKKEAPFLANLAMQFAAILSSDYANFLAKEGKQENLSTQPIGTGSFIFKKWLRDDRIICLANKNYWNKRPYVNKLIFKVIPNSSVRAAELITGSIHIMDFPNPTDIKNLEKNKNIKFAKQEGLNIDWLVFNTLKKPFDNKLVRQALSYAINTKAIVKSVYEGLGKVAVSAIPPTMWSYNKKLKGYKYNPKKAKELLKKAGFKNGFKTSILARPAANGKKIVEAIQADLTKVGIKAKIISYDWGTFLKKTSYGEYDMALLGWAGDNGDPDNFLNVLLSAHSANVKPSENRGFWKNKEFTKLVDKAKITTDIAKRTALYKKAQLIFEEEAPTHPIANKIVIEPMLKKVYGFKLDPVGIVRFKNVYIEK